MARIWFPLLRLCLLQFVMCQTVVALKDGCGFVSTVHVPTSRSRLLATHSRLMKTTTCLPKPLRGGQGRGLASNLRGSAAGYAAALAGPAVSALGILIWEGSWKGSSFMLNAVKCTLASLALLAFLWLQNGAAIFGIVANIGPGVLAPLLLSSFLGIIVGDLTWLAALKRLGARRTILTDCARPVFAALVGLLVLGEQLSLQTAAGMALATAGITLAVSSSSSPPDSEPSPSSSALPALGFALAFVHLALDTLGSALTKTASAGVDPPIIVLIRFGFAACILCATSAAMAARAALSPPSPPSSSDDSALSLPWWALPQDLSRLQWARIAAGCLLVTCLAPTLFVASLQRLPLGLALTLASLGPLYEQPLSYILYRRRPSAASLGGGVVAILGVALLCMKPALA